MRECDDKIGVAQAQAVAFPPSDDDKSHIRDEAFAQGIADFENGRNAPPAEFGSDAELVRWWNEGYDFAAELDDMSHCSGCNDGTGNPCITHG